MLWSIVAKAVEKSSKQRHDIICDPVCIDEVIVDVQKICFGGVMFAAD